MRNGKRKQTRKASRERASHAQTLLNAMREDERELIERLLSGEKRAWIIAQELGISPERLEEILETWGNKGWWNYGVSARTGWLENYAYSVFNRNRVQ